METEIGTPKLKGPGRYKYLENTYNQDDINEFSEYILSQNNTLKILAAQENWEALYQAILKDSNLKTSFYFLYRYFLQLAAFNILEHVQKIPDEGFAFISDLDEITLPNNINELGQNAFSRSKFKKITLSENISYIPDACFFACGKLIDIHLPHALKEIGSEAFAVCSSLSSITLPVTVSRIGAEIFKGCYHFDTIKFLGTAKQWKKIKKDRKWCFQENYVSERYIKVECIDKTIEYLSTDKTAEREWRRGHREIEKQKKRLEKEYNKPGK